MSTPKAIPVPQHIFCRLSSSSVDVVHRHADNPVIAATGEAMVPVAEQYQAAYSSLVVARANQSAMVAASHAKTAALDRTISAWLGPLGRDAEGFDTTTIGARPEVTLDVIADGYRVLEIVQARAGSLPYAEHAMKALRPSLEAAEAAHDRAQNARIELQHKQAELRTIAETLKPHLVALRRVLRVQLGTSHHDYQRLRAFRGRSEADDLDAIEVVEGAADEQLAPAVDGADSQARPLNGHSTVTPQ